MSWKATSKRAKKKSTRLLPEETYQSKALEQNEMYYERLEASIRELGTNMRELEEELSFTEGVEFVCETCQKDMIDAMHDGVIFHKDDTLRMGFLGV